MTQPNANSILPDFVGLPFLTSGFGCKHLHYQTFHCSFMGPYIIVTSAASRCTSLLHSSGLAFLIKPGVFCFLSVF